MARPLERRTREGRLYERLPAVEASIDRAMGLGTAALLAEAAIEGEERAGHLRSECLVHLLRAMPVGSDDPRLLGLLEILVGRMERSLRGSVRASRAYDAGELRAEVVERFVDLLVEDRETPGTRLDFFEVRFARALAALRVDVMREALRDLKRVEHLENLRGDDGEVPPVVNRGVLLAFQGGGAEQERERFRNELLRAIDLLPAHQREAVTLFLAGHDTEGDGTETIASICGVSDRAIRYRLTKAIAALRQRFGERP